jgi:Uma2 family endonuclease
MATTTQAKRRTRLPSKNEPFTYQDYLRLPPSPYREEVLQGELVVSPSPSSWHQYVSMKLATRLENHIEAQALGSLFAGPIDVVLSETDVAVPDLVFVAAARQHVIRQRGIFGPPDLIVEILSPSRPRQDTDTKRRVYARYGVPHYWIVDPEQRRIWLFRLSEAGKYECMGEYGGDETFCAEPFPELEIPLEQVWPPERS